SGDFTAITTSPFTDAVQVQVATLDPATLEFGFSSQTLRGGLGPVAVDVTIAPGGVGTITGSPLVFAGGELAPSATFHHGTVVGTSQITIGTPAGFPTPSTRQQIPATVRLPGIPIEDVVVGKDLEVFTQLGLVPSRPLTVTLSVADPTKALLTASYNLLGSGSLVAS